MSQAVQRKGNEKNITNDKKKIVFVQTKRETLKKSTFLRPPDTAIEMQRKTL